MIHIQIVEDGVGISEDPNFLGVLHCSDDTRLFYSEDIKGRMSCDISRVIKYGMVKLPLSSMDGSFFFNFSLQYSVKLLLLILAKDV